MAVISDLLWSVRRECTLREPARAFELIPRILKALERLHRPVLKLRAKHRHQTLQAFAELPPDEDLRPVGAQTPNAAEELWLAPDEQEAFDFEDTLPTEYAPPDPAAGTSREPAAAPAAHLGDSEAETLVASLHEGCWVDLYSRKRWRRARLTWASAKGNFFMFVGHGGLAHP